MELQTEAGKKPVRQGTDPTERWHKTPKGRIRTGHQAYPDTHAHMHAGRQAGRRTWETEKGRGGEEEKQMVGHGRRKGGQGSNGGGAERRKE